MNFKKAALISPVAVLLLAGLTACGGGSDTSSADDQTLVTNTEEAPQATGGFGAPVVTPDKVSYTLTAPAHFTPGKFASGMLDGNMNERFDLTVVNNSGKDLDLATLMVTGSTTTGACVDIFDGDNAMEGAPTTPLAAGATANFSWGLSCAGKSGDDITVRLSNGTTTLIEVVGKLA
jgi:hypothetical protein